MKNLYMFIIVFINLILQVTLYSFVKIFGVVPNIALILVVIFALATNDIMGGALGLFTGLLYDLMIMDVIGINTLIYFVIGVSLGSLSNDINKENKWLYILFAGLATIFYHLATMLALFFLKVNIASVSLILNKIILQIALNCLFCFILYKFINFIFSKLKIKLFTNH